jgi:hypothetical protein
VSHTGSSFLLPCVAFNGVGDGVGLLVYTVVIRDVGDAVGLVVVSSRGVDGAGGGTRNVVGAAVVIDVDGFGPPEEEVDVTGDSDGMAVVGIQLK